MRTVNVTPTADGSLVAAVVKDEWYDDGGNRLRSQQYPDGMEAWPAPHQDDPSAARRALRQQARQQHAETRAKEREQARAMVRGAHEALVRWGERALAEGAHVTASSEVRAFYLRWKGRRGQRRWGRRTGWVELARRVGVTVGQLKELARAPRPQ